MDDPDVAVGVAGRAGHLAKRPAIRDVRPGWIHDEFRDFHVAARNGRSGAGSAPSGITSATTVARARPASTDKNLRRGAVLARRDASKLRMRFNLSMMFLPFGFSC